MRGLTLLALCCAGCSEYAFTPYEVVDVFIQDPPDQVDILLVVDNSGSMLGYQLLIGARFNEFLTYFLEADVDYHIGVVTTTIERGFPGEGCTQEDVDAVPDAGHLHLDTFISPDTVDPETVFGQITRVGTCGSGDEQGLEAARIALSPALLTTSSRDFIRPEASLSVIFVSDEQDASVEPVSHYVNAYHLVKGSRERGAFNASALVLSDIDDCVFPVGGSSEGTRYVAVAQETGGVVGNLCNTNFADIVTELSLNASRLRDTFFLSDLPDLTTLVVSVEDEELPCDDGRYAYQLVDDHGTPRPAIVFDRLLMPRSGEQIAVRYNRGTGDPATFCTPAGDAR